MFDWNDEELANIVWGEAGDTDENYMRQTEKIIHQTKDEACGRKVDGGFNKEMSASRFSMDSWTGSSLSNAAESGQDSMGTEVSQNINETTKYGSSRGKDKGGFVEDGWANIGSFDDLDQIFSNEDPIYSDVSLGNDDELWSSSKDITNDPVKSSPIYVDSLDLGLGSLRNITEHLEIKTEYVQEDDNFFTLGCGKMDGPAYHGLQNSNANINHVKYAGTKSKLVLKQKDPVVAEKTTVKKSRLTYPIVAASNEFADKFCRQRKLLKSQKSEERNKGNALQELYDRWPSPGEKSSRFKNQLLPSMLHPSSNLIQQRQLRGPESLHNQHLSNQFVPPSAYENLTHPHPTMSMLYHNQSGELKHQPLLSGFTVSPVSTNSVNKSADTCITHQTMTPQEKIDKLRRRQQMKAMLAIQKQQQQYNNQISSSDHCTTQKGFQENHIQNVGGADLEAEYPSNPPSLDPCSTMEHDGSNAFSVAIDDYSWEETILYQLQDIVAKLDMKLRLCIRDSLFRLCQNAVQRQYADDTSSTNREEHGILRQKISRRNKYARMPEMETETNHTDRMVARSLFHGLLDVPVKYTTAPELSAYTKLPCEHRTARLKNLPMGCLPENSKIKQAFSRQGFENSCPLYDSQHVDQFRTGHYMDMSENASTSSLADGGALKVNAS